MKLDIAIYNSRNYWSLLAFRMIMINYAYLSTIVEIIEAY